MMTDPSVNSLLEKVNSRFTLCIVTGKRARQLIDGAHKLTDCSSENAVTVAANEINEDMITYVRTRSSIK
ncbi:DNA-directed RNA polymerase subunit omega [Geosporobacter ferrireducens]|nr:DNA-directed RNA polymerase subunit omega [Geosporobacter ferrireducens]